MNRLNSVNIVDGSFVMSTQVDLNDIKIFCKVTTGDFEDNFFIPATNDAVDEARKQSGLIIGQAQYVATYDCLSSYSIKLPFSPLFTIDSIKGLNEDGTENLLDSGDYYISSKNQSKVTLKSGKSWPDTDRYVGGYEITYTCKLDVVPEPVIAGIKEAVFDRYVDRTALIPRSAIIKWQSCRNKFLL